jgi:magnesium chelatase subunit D
MHDALMRSQTEVRDMAKKMMVAGIQLLVIDTENKFVSTGFAEEIAKAAGKLSP